MFVYSVLGGVALTWIEPAGVLDPTAYQDLYFTKQLRAEGLNISFALVSGTLPDGVTLSPSGLLTGTPTTLQTYSFTVRITDSQGKTSDRTFLIPVLIASGSLWFNGWQGPALIYSQNKTGLAATVFLDTAASTWWTTWDATYSQIHLHNKNNREATITLDTAPSTWWTTWTNT